MLADLPLYFVSAALLLAAASMAPGSLWRVIGRLRVLLLMLCLLFAWQTPGRYLYAEFGGWSPSVEGLQLGALHAMRLCACVAVVAVMTHFLQPSDWVRALRVLGAPLRPLGFNPDRLAVRLQLVLHLVQEVRAADWRSLLSQK